MKLIYDSDKYFSNLAKNTNYFQMKNITSKSTVEACVLFNIFMLIYLLYFLQGIFSRTGSFHQLQ